MPIVNRQFLSPGNIDQTATEEPFLFSAILVIATKDKVDLEAKHRSIWAHLKRMILDVALGSSITKCVGAVEALLLLAEWVPHARFQRQAVGNDKSRKLRREDIEDSASWTLVNLAVRQSYLLHLDKYSFRGGEQGESKAVSDRSRLAWTCETAFVLCS